MKKLSMLGFALVMLAILLPGQASAQFQYDNQVGLYTTADGLGATGTSVMGSPVSVYLVLTKPRDEQNGNAPYFHCLAFECTLHFSDFPENFLILLQSILPPLNVDIGLRKDINEGYLDFVAAVSINAPIPVINDAVQLVELIFINFYTGMIEVNLEPSEPRQSISGEMAYIGNDAIDELQVMYSKGGSHEAPVFIFNGMAVPVESESFGSVKALYR